MDENHQSVPLSYGNTKRSPWAEDADELIGMLDCITTEKIQSQYWSSKLKNSTKEEKLLYTLHLEDL